jgi:hypothetical protein
VSSSADGHDGTSTSPYRVGVFLTPDPIPGGNANAYVYPADPITQFDLNGQWCVFGTHGGNGGGCRGGAPAKATGKGLKSAANFVYNNTVNSYQSQNARGRDERTGDI